MNLDETIATTLTPLYEKGKSINEEDIWKSAFFSILDSYFRDDYREALVSHQLTSYNYFIKYGLSRIIESYNPVRFLVENKQSDMGDLNKKIKYFEHIIVFSKARVKKPNVSIGVGKGRRMLYPNECRIRNTTYQADISVNINHTVQFLGEDKEPINSEAKKEIIKENIKIGSIPVMLHSILCNLYQLPNDVLRRVAKEDPFDLGGYFVINGGEKVLITQEKKINNHVTYYYNEKKQYPHVCEIKCTKDDTFGSPTTATVKYDKKGKIWFSLNPGFAPKVNIPIFVMFKALGILDDKTIVDYIMYNSDDETMLNLLKPSMNHQVREVDDSKEKETYVVIQTQEQAINYIAEQIRIAKAAIFLTRGIKRDDVDKKVEYMLGVFNKYLFPHIKIASSNDLRAKAYFLGYMCNKLLLGIEKLIHQDDRDNYALKRVETSGILISQLFYQIFSIFVSKLKDSIRRESVSKSFKASEMEGMIYRAIPENEIESKCKKAFSTGEWSVSRSPGGLGRQGVAQLLQRLTPLNNLSELRRIVTPQGANQKTMPEIRRLHNTHWGYCCPVETPEGHSVGMVKNLSVLAKITSSSSTVAVMQVLKKMDNIIDIMGITPGEIKYYTKIFINGDWIACTGNAENIVKELRQCRRQMNINPGISIVRDYVTNEIRIYSDAGRLIRPLFVVDENNKIRITPAVIQQLHEGKLQWDDLIKQQYIEYIEVQESIYNCLIAMYPSDLSDPKNKLKRYTHCEIHPYTILGVAASLIPFCNHNQSPRNLFQCAQGKQALSIYAMNYRDRMDTMGHVLYYPQIPLVHTGMAKHIRYNDQPAGMNVIIAIMSYTG